jgi:hypothetical protein
MREVIGEHLGENITRYVLEVLKEYDIIRNLGYFIINNVPNNDIMIITLSHSLYKDFGLKYDLIHY